MFLNDPSLPVIISELIFHQQRNIYIHDNITFRNSKLTAFLMLNTLDMHYAVKNILHFLIADGVSK